MKMVAKFFLDFAVTRRAGTVRAPLGRSVQGGRCASAEDSLARRPRDAGGLRTG